MSFRMISGFIATVAVLVMTPGLVLSQVPPTPSGTGVRPGISVLGEGIVLAQPDVSRVTLGVETFDRSLAAAQGEAARRMEAVVQRLRAAGIAEGDIRTVSFSISPQYDSREGQSVLRGYQVQNLVDVKVGDIQGLGALIDGVVAAGASRVYGIRFEASDVERLKALARDQAMQNARAKADQLARDAGVSLGGPITIEESDVGGVNPVRADERAAPAALAAPSAQTPIQPGELQVRTVVRVVWALQ